MSPQSLETPPRARPQGEEDGTPYGRSTHFGPGVFLATCGWVFTASAHRLAHLALVAASRTSGRFVFWVVGWLALSAAALQLGNVGWRRVESSVSLGRAPERPAGRGWYHVAGGDRADVTGGRARLVSVWWNAPLAMLASVQAFVVTILAAVLLLKWQRWRVHRALPPEFRSQGRLGAARHYATAWLLWVACGATVAGLAPLGHVSAVARWSLQVPPLAIYALAAILAVAGFCGYWFWLTRVGGTAPTPARTRMVTLFGVWNPLLIAATTAGLAFASRHLTELISHRLGLAWQ